MKRTKLRDRILPGYTHGEELFNMISHIVGGGLGVIIFALCVIKSFLNWDVPEDEEPTCLYLFPYDSGIVKVGE